MTEIQFSNPEFPALRVPDENLMALLEPREAESTRPVSELAEAALDHPEGSPPLEKLASPSSRVLLLVDDITRQTPAYALLPSILQRLESAGCPRQNISILIAAGTHAHMTEEELVRKLGAQARSGYTVHLHHWREERNLRQIGATSTGVPIRVNRLLGEADLVVGVGMIVPHRVMGFTGGASIVQPGVSGPEITGHTHWISAIFSGAQIMGVAENPVRQEVEKIARLAGLRFIVNVVMDARERVASVVAGDVVGAHRRGAALSRAIYGVAQPELADVVVAESYPADYDLWQASKGVYAAELSVRQGGIVILVSPCAHGVSEEHPEVERLGYRGVKEVEAMLESHEITDRVAAAHLAHVGRVIRDQARGIMVSAGIDAATRRRIGFEPASTPNEALEKALQQLGGRARVVALRQGGHVLPLVAGVAGAKPAAGAAS